MFSINYVKKVNFLGLSLDTCQYYCYICDIY